MYTWIASFFGDETNENSLYAQQTEQQQKQEGQEEWTWIEVFEDKEEDGIIIVQTDESTRLRNMESGVVSSSLNNKRKRRMTKSDTISRKVFKRSLYTDLPLMRKVSRVSTPSSRALKRLSCGRPSAGRRPCLDVQLRRFCKAHQTTSQVLSSTLHTSSIRGSGDELFKLMSQQNEFEFDLTHLLQNTTFLKTILEAIIKHKIQLDQPLQQWFDLMLTDDKHNQQGRHRLKRHFKEQLSIDWRDTSSDEDSSLSFIEFREDAPSTHPLIEEITEDDVQIIEVRYPLPRWMRRIKVFGECEDHNNEDFLKKMDITEFRFACGEHHYLPVHTCQTEQQARTHVDFKRIDALCFDGACGECHAPDTLTCEALTHVPCWMQRIDLCGVDLVAESQFPYVEIRGGDRFPLWMKRMDIVGFNVHDAEVEAGSMMTNVPSWMQRMHHDVIDGSADYELYKVPSWMKRIHLMSDEERKEREVGERFDYGLRGSNSWFSSRCSVAATAAGEIGSFYQRHTSETSLLSSCQTLCNSVINFAMVLATATCTETIDADSAEILSSGGSSSRRSSAVITSEMIKKKKLSFQQTSASAKQLATKQARKNKKWLRKTNNTANNRSHTKRQRYTATSFSGRKSVRAC